MFHSQLNEDLSLGQRYNGPAQTRLAPMLLQREYPPQDAEAISQMLETSLQELSQPIRAILCWSKLLLSELQPHHPLAMNLDIIVEETEFMNEIVRGLNLLTNQNSGLPK